MTARSLLTPHCSGSYDKKITVGGFTMIEVAIMMAIVVLISAIVLASFPAVSERIRLQRSTQSLALALRRAQNKAFAVRQENTVGCGVTVPPAFGVNIEQDGTDVIIFADLRAACTSGSNNRVYDPSQGESLERVALERGISISQLVAEPDSFSPTTEDELNISFTIPQATVEIKNRSTIVGETAEIFLSGESGTMTRSVRVRTTGQIRIK